MRKHDESLSQLNEGGKTPLVGGVPMGGSSSEDRRSETDNANPPIGERGDFVKFTVTLPPAIYQQLAHEAAQRKMTKTKGSAISAIIRDAIAQYFRSKGGPSISESVMG